MTHDSKLKLEQQNGEGSFQPHYDEAELLGPEFGAAITSDGDIAPLRFREIMKDPGLGRLGVEIWQKMRNPDSVDIRALEEAGLSIQELFGPDMAETDSASSHEELRRYRERLEIRADFLEALLEITLSELESLGPATGAIAGTDTDKGNKRERTGQGERGVPQIE